MKRLISILSMAMMLVCCVLAVPTAVSAATAPTFTDSGDQETSESTQIKNVYLNGLDAEIDKAESGTNLLVIWYDMDGGIAGEKEVSPSAVFYAGSTENISTQYGESMSIALTTAVDTIYTGGKTGTSLNGLVYLTLYQDASIQTLHVEAAGNTGGSYINFLGSNTDITTVEGAAGNDKITVSLTKESGMTVEKLKKMGFSDATFTAPATVCLDAGDKGKFSDGETTASVGAVIGEVVFDPDDEYAQRLLAEVTPIPAPGYKLDGWYLDRAFTRPFDLQKTVLTWEHFAEAPADLESGGAYITLYAKWVPVSHDTGESDTGRFLPVLLMMTGAAAGLAGGMRMMRKSASVK